MPGRPCPRCAPARPPRMRRGARARTRAARPRAPWTILSPLVSQPTTPVCPDSCRSRRELLNEVLYACWVRDFGLKNRFKGKNFLPGLRPGPRIEHPSLDAPPRRSGGLVAAQREVSCHLARSGRERHRHAAAGFIYLLYSGVIIACGVWFNQNGWGDFEGREAAHDIVAWLANAMDISLEEQREEGVLV